MFQPGHLPGHFPGQTGQNTILAMSRKRDKRDTPPLGVSRCCPGLRAGHFLDEHRATP
jgi:hypothetical protein